MEIFFKRYKQSGREKKSGEKNYQAKLNNIIRKKIHAALNLNHKENFS